MSPPEVALRNLTVRLGDPAGECRRTGLPLLAGEAVEDLFPEAIPAGEHGAFSVHTCGDFRIGIAQGDGCGDVGGTAFRLYGELLGSLAGTHLCRIWNYVPGINATNREGLENYRAFCRGRALAFESRFGEAFERLLPAASAVGSDSDRLIVVFAAHRIRPRHFENPLQTPAYRYPLRYGPRPPSFARASLVPLPAGGHHAFVSGTAAIRGHLTLHEGDFAGQMECTLENLAELGRECGLGGDLAAGRCSLRHIKVYLRREGDLAAACAGMAGLRIGPRDRVSFLRSDLCRSDLAVEIEVTALGVRGDAS